MWITVNCLPAHRVRLNQIKTFQKVDGGCIIARLYDWRRKRKSALGMKYSQLKQKLMNSRFFAALVSLSRIFGQVPTIILQTLVYDCILCRVSDYQYYRRRYWIGIHGYNMEYLFSNILPTVERDEATQGLGGEELVADCRSALAGLQITVLLCTVHLSSPTLCFGVI
ncbi:hypothetical protein ASPWEDRAFT_510285 [Aspergillus wentii DTO 134E9]|uniref:Uncharacterized protein n=1 Tax=Aspergillus wentii DTO 134E9 TaxID=1073089 RepID=A0A1L9RKN2_ASPWE|nr:uncharacterized protein ASPWEDRAFT_510285 [Aspergillus wentii DTO 134E9]OJJ35464.1 hypothetical protein ASPWEDRAFT_510285 [Aspergillus wentii DTO 134E9]